MCREKKAEYRTNALIRGREFDVKKIKEKLIIVVNNNRQHQDKPKMNRETKTVRKTTVQATN